MTRTMSYTVAWLCGAATVAAVVELGRGNVVLAICMAVLSEICGVLICAHESIRRYERQQIPPFSDAGKHFSSGELRRSEELRKK